MSHSVVDPARSRPLFMVFVFAAAAAVAPHADAQTPTIPVPAAGPCGISADATRRASPVEALTRAYHSGAWRTFQAMARDIIGALPGDCATAGGYQPRDFVLLIWPASHPTTGKQVLLAAAIPPVGYTRATDGYQLQFPGVGGDSGRKVYQMFLSARREDQLAAVYFSARQRNPLLEQVPEVAEAIVSPLLALAAATQGTIRTRMRALTEDTAAAWITVSAVALPFTRASIRLNARATTLLLTEKSVVDAAADLKTELELMDVRYSSCARGLAARHLKAITETVAVEGAACVQKVGSECLRKLDPLFAAAYREQSPEPVNSGQTCGTVAAEVRGMQLVDQRFRTLILDREMRSDATVADMELDNLPLERFSFGVVSGVLAGTFTSAQRVTVDDGVLVADPLRRQINMVVLNGSFRKYNPAAFDLSRAERFRWFAGTVITPSFGVGGGVSVLVVRGLAVNAGVAVLGVTGPADGQAVGSAPIDTHDPYKLEAVGGFFLGASFNFR